VNADIFKVGRGTKEATEMLEKEFQYFLDHKDELVKKYKGKYIIIVGDQVKGSYNSQKEAYDKTIGTYEEGTFLIQLCSPDEDAYTHYFHSRIAI
jgi:hypothetical protein